jgi:hypothetical protein
MKILLKHIIKTLTFFLNSSNNFLKKMDNFLNDDDLTLIRTSNNTLGRNKTFILSNDKLLEKRDLFFQIYMFLMNNEEFLDFGKYKIVIVNGKIKNNTFNLHHNILIRNDTCFDDYWNKIEDILENVYDEGYAIEGIPVVEINVWNMDLYANKKIKITKNALTGEELLNITNKHLVKNKDFNLKPFLSKKFYSTKSPFSAYHCLPDWLETKEHQASNDNDTTLAFDQPRAKVKEEDQKYLSYITPIKQPKSMSKVINLIEQNKSSFSSMDIETMEFNGQELPISISIKTKNISEIFIIDNSSACFKPVGHTPSCSTSHLNDKLLVELNIALKDLWDKFFDFILVNCNKDVIFVHNLGSFDGFFIYKALSNRFKPEEVTCLIDNHNKFIQITLIIDKLKIVFKDSYRIFPVSLNDLCNVLGLPGKTSSYRNEFHKISLFTNPSLLQEFKEYSIQDSIALFDCLYKLQEMYLMDYQVDICSILSTSTLSMKIFRSKFLNVDIPILKRLDDTFIRQSYFGGATDYYQLRAENLYYYDVNSLYPFAMMKPMPFKLIKKIKVFSNNFNLNNFFGYLKVEVTCPKTIKVPVLPCKHNGKTIFPTGKWIGTYFSEELKAVKPLGYNFKFYQGYEFSKIDLFSDYVNNFYEQKRNSIGPSRFIAKMHLNTLYGIFGRRYDLLETRNIYKKDLENYIFRRAIKSIIPINDKIITLLMHSNIRYDLIKELNSELDIELRNQYNLVKANVAIASAVTSYARIHMIPFKIDGNCIYSDTDSIFTTKKLELKFIGSDLGLMKDELKGLIIKEGYFLGIKKYGYQYIDNRGSLITKSTFAGIQRDSLTFEEIIQLSEGSTLIKRIPIRFYKCLKKLNIVIDTTHVSISRSLDKPLINNKYIPLHLNLPRAINNSFLNYLKKKILILIKTIIN